MDGAKRSSSSLLLVLVITAIVGVVAYLSSPSFQTWVHHPVVMADCKFVRDLPDEVCRVAAMLGSAESKGRTEGSRRWSARAEEMPFGLSFKTAITVINFDNGDLEGVVVEVRGEGVEFDGRKVPGVWRTKPINLPEEVEFKILTEHLADAKGVSPPCSLKIDTLRVLDRSGRRLFELSPVPTSRPAR